MSNTTVIYHANCVDGFTAAFFAWRQCPDARFVAANYGDPPPYVKGRDVYILDFSYPRAVLYEMRKQAASMLVLDHHKTAQEDLQGLAWARFDMNKSGAMLAFEYFVHPKHAGSTLARYVQDRDLWRWELPESREVSAYIATIPRTFAAWYLLEDELCHRLNEAVEKGSTALRVVEQYVETQRDRAALRSIAGHIVPVINTTFAVSELLGELARGFPFAVGWFQRIDGKFQYSLRSSAGGMVDVSLIAKQYGGGGHRNAAGFESEVLL